MFRVAIVLSSLLLACGPSAQLTLESAGPVSRGAQVELALHNGGLHDLKYGYCMEISRVPGEGPQPLLVPPPIQMAGGPDGPWVESEACLLAAVNLSPGETLPITLQLPDNLTPGNWGAWIDLLDDDKSTKETRIFAEPFEVLE